VGWTVGAADYPSYPHSKKDENAFKLGNGSLSPQQQRSLVSNETVVPVNGDITVMERCQFASIYKWTWPDGQPSKRIDHQCYQT
jgi:hypothetical protein